MSEHEVREAFIKLCPTATEDGFQCFKAGVDWVHSVSDAVDSEIAARNPGYKPVYWNQQLSSTKERNTDEQ